MKNNLFFMIFIIIITTITGTSLFIWTQNVDASSNIPCCGTMTLYNKTPMSVQISLQIGDPEYYMPTLDCLFPILPVQQKQQTRIMILLK